MTLNAKDQSSFEEFDFDESAINLHKHEGQILASTVLVFVHGLNGSGYETWQRFPRYIFEDVRAKLIDVAVFDYFSGSRRRLLVRPAVEDIAEALAKRLHDLSAKYDEIYIICHSMGGLVGRLAVKRYIEIFSRDVERLLPIAGIVLFATPLGGSRLSRPIFRFLITEAVHLTNGSRLQKELSEFFDSHLASEDEPVASVDRYRLPTYAAYGELDVIVDKKSATLGIPEDQTVPFRAGHSELVKPTFQKASQVLWLRETVSSISKNRASNRVSATGDLMGSTEKIHASDGPLRVGVGARNPLQVQPRNTLITEASFGLGGLEWLNVYQRVISGASTSMVSVKDIGGLPSNHPARLLISIHRIDDILVRHEDTRAKLQEAGKRFNHGGIDVRVIGVGEEQDNSRPSAEELIGGTSIINGFHFFIDFADNLHKLENKIAQSVALLVAMLEDALELQKEEIDHENVFTVAVPKLAEGNEA